MHPERTGSRSVWLISLVFAGLVSSSRGDSWTTLTVTEFKSATGQYVLRITPATDWADQPGFCKAELFAGDAERGRLRWFRYLINNRGPVRVYVTNSGEYVVTMDEWGHFGFLPLVIYGPHGRLIRVHDLGSLGLLEDLPRIMRTEGSDWWAEHALVFFGPTEETLLIRLHWGKLLIVDLRTGRRLEKRDYGDEEWRSLHRFVAARSKVIVLALLQACDADDRVTGATHAGQLGVKEAAPLLRKLLADDSTYQEGVFQRRTVFFVRDAAKRALTALGEEFPDGEVRSDGAPMPKSTTASCTTSPAKSR